MKALTRGRYSVLCCFLFEVWLLLFFAHSSDRQVFVSTISMPAITENMYLYTTKYKKLSLPLLY